MSKAKTLKMFTIDDLAEFDGTNGKPLYVLIEGNVYDLTKFDHPGGKDVFENDPDFYEDLHDRFSEIHHSQKAKNMMKQYKIGELKK
jgi:cytochrome b involved in lipid metabolism